MLFSVAYISFHDNIINQSIVEGDDWKSALMNCKDFQNTGWTLGYGVDTLKILQDILFDYDATIDVKRIEVFAGVPVLIPLEE